MQQQIAIANAKPPYCDSYKATSYTLGAIFTIAWVSYLVFCSLGLTHGSIEKFENRTMVVNPNFTIATAGALPLFMTVVIATFFFRYLLIRPPKNEELEELKQSERLLLSELDYPIERSRNIELPLQHIPEVFKWLSPQKKQKLNFLQLETLFLHDAEVFRESLDSHSFSKEQELIWNKLLTFVDLSIAIKSNQQPSFHKNESKRPLFQTEPYRDLLTAFQNPFNAQHMDDLLFVEALIHTLSFDENDTEIIASLGEKIAAIHELPRGLDWQAIVMKMKEQRCSFEKAGLPLQPHQAVHDITFLVAAGHKVTANRKLLAEHSEVFQVMLCGPLKGHIEVNRDFDISLSKAEVDAAAFELLIELLEGRDNSDFSTDSILWAEVAKLADCYQFKCINRIIEEKLILSLASCYGDYGSLLLLMECADTYSYVGLHAAIDSHFASGYCTPLPKRLSEKSADLTIFAVENRLTTSVKKLRFHFREEIFKLIASAGDNLADTTKMIPFIASIASRSQETLLVIWNDLSPLFEHSPQLLKELWEISLKEHLHALQQIIVTFCQSDEAYPIWIASWSTPPQLKGELLEIV
jgi:hypothetical protein